MKILILSEACFNDNIFPMYKAMQGKGHDVTCLINLSSLKVALFDIKQRIPIQGIINVYEYPELRIYRDYMDLSKMFFVNHQVDRKHPWRELTSTISIIRFIKQGHFDIIHTDINFRRAKLLLYCFRKRIVYVQHDPFGHSGMEFSKWTKIYMKIAYKLLNKIVILNKFHYHDFCEINHIDSQKVFVNKLGPLDCINLFKDPLVKERKNNILFFGRIVQYKGIEYICEAMVEVHNIIPDASLTIAGSGSFYFDISPYKKLPYIEIHNRFIEEKELARFLQECSISICTYTDATQSGGILTSFAMDKPVIASDLDTLREMVTNGYDCILVPPRDSKALAQAIIRILTDNSLKKQLSENIAYEYKEGNKSWNSIVDKYLEIYQT